MICLKKHIHKEKHNGNYGLDFKTTRTGTRNHSPNKFLEWFWRKKENDRIADSVNAEIEIANLEKVSKGLRARDALHRLKYERMLKSARYKRKD